MTMHIERVAPVAKTAITLLCTSVFFGALSVVTHSHLHRMSHLCLVVSMTLGFFALLKVFNSASSKLFFSSFVHWVHAMCFELVAFMGVLLLRLLRRAMPRGALTGTRKGKASGKPILLVHGYCNDSTVWIYIQRQLEQRTGHPIYVIDLGHPFRSMNEYAGKVAERVVQICQETGSKDLILIGHSMGGVVSSLVAWKIPTAICSVFTIGSPLSGTHMARIALGLNGREMQRRSKLMCDLNDQFGTDTKVQFYHIATKTDQIVIPGSSALRGKYPEREFLFEDIGHASLLFSPRVAALLVHWLKEANVG